MKRCPECRRDYYDDSLLYCLDDGAALLEGPASLSEPPTAILPHGADHVVTQPQIHATDQAEPTRATQMLKATSGNGKWKIVALAIGILALVSGAVVWYRWSKAGAPKASVSMKVTRLTAHGQVGLPAISPDGKYVIYTLWDAGKGTLWLRQASTNSAVPLVQPASEDVNYGGRTFSRNGEMIYYVFWDKDNARGVLMELPTLGGVPRKVLTDITSGISFSPDGKKFAFRRVIEKDGASQILTADLDGGDQRVVATRSGNDFFAGDPSWSPDGKMISCGVGSGSSSSYSVVSFPIEGGAGIPVTQHQWRGELSGVAWLADGSSMVVAAAEEPSAASQIWEVSIPAGSVRQITNDLNGYNYVSVTADSSALVTRQLDTTERIWTYTLGDDPTHAKQISNGKNDGEAGLSWTPDGKIVYAARSGDNYDLWIINEDGSGNRPLNSDASVEYSPCVTPDGRYIAFGSDRDGGAIQIYRMKTDGSDVKRLVAADAMPDSLACSPDSKWVVFGSFRGGPHTMWKVPIEGGDPVQIGSKPVQECYFQPSNDLVCMFSDEQFSPPKRRVAQLSFDGGDLTRVFDIPRPSHAHSMIPDGRSFVYAISNGGTDNLWGQPLGGGKPTQLTNFKGDAKTDLIFRVVWSSDSKRLAMVRGNSATDVVLIKDFHQP